MVVAVVLSIALPVCFVVLLIGCLDCLFRKRRLEGFRSQDTTDGRHTNAFSVDICDAPNTSEQVTIEPLPDILSKVSTAPALRPQITFVDRGEHASTAPLTSVQRSFPRDHLTYLNEIGSGWFGKAIESEAIQIVGGSLKSHVVVKMLKDDASKLEQKQFMDEVHAYRCLDHANIMSLLGQCTETAPFLVILEFAAYGSLKNFLVEQSQDLEMLVTKKRYISLALDAAAGLASLHRHDYIHNDLAARNCLVMSDYTLKIGDYGISDHLFKNEYYNTGTELLPVRWMAPETLVKSNGVWTTQPHNKMSDMWSFGILLWEICSVGERPYDMLTDEAVLQGVVQDKLLLPSDMDMKLPFKDRLWSVMTQCWRDASCRLDVVQAYDILEQLLSVRLDTVDTMSDFDQKWNQLKQNQERAPNNDTNLGSRTALAGSFATDDSSSPADKPSLLDSDGGALESITSDDLIIDVGGADEMPTPTYQSPPTVLANSFKAADNPGQRKISSASEDQVFVENEITNTSVLQLQSHMAPVKSVDQAARTTDTLVFHDQGSDTGAYTADSDSRAGQTTQIERHIYPTTHEANIKNIGSVKNDLSLNVEGHSLNKLTSGTQEAANPSKFDSRLQTSDEDFSDFVRTSPTAPSLDFTDFASGDNSFFAHDEHVDSDLQLEAGKLSGVSGNDTETHGQVDTPTETAADNTSFDHDFDAFSDFVTSDPPNKSGTTEIIPENLATAPSYDKSPGLAESFIKKDTSALDDNREISDSDSDTFSDFVSSLPARESDGTPVARLNDDDDENIASGSLLSTQGVSLDVSFPKSDPEPQNQTESLPTAPPNSNTDFNTQGSLKDCGYDSESSSVTVDFEIEKLQVKNISADHNQNIFPSDLSSLSPDIPLLITDSVATFNGRLPVESKQLKVDVDVHKIPDTDVELSETDGKVSGTDVKVSETDENILHGTDDNNLPETYVKVSETDDSNLPRTDGKVSETDDRNLSKTDGKVSGTADHKVPETDVKVSETDVKVSETDVKVSETDVKVSGTADHKVPETDVKVSETDVKVSETDDQNLPETDGKFSETDDQNLPETDVKVSETDVKVSETDDHKVPETDVNISETEVQLSETQVQFSEKNVQFSDTDFQQFDSPEVLDQEKPSPSLITEKSINLLESFDFLAEKVSSVAATDPGVSSVAATDPGVSSVAATDLGVSSVAATDPGVSSVAATDRADAEAVVDHVSVEKDDETKQESGNLDVQPGMSFDLLDSDLVQESDTSILSLSEILGKQTSTEPTQLESSKPLDDGFGFDLIPGATGSHAAPQSDLIADLQKTNGDTHVTSAEHVEPALIDF